MIMKILVTGGSGLLGRAIMREFRTISTWQLCGTCFSRCRDGLVRLDLRDAEAVRNLLMAERPAVIVHAAAERRPDIGQQHPEDIRALNVQATRTLAELAGQLNSWLVYISTDYVFDGTCPPYRPGDTPHPLNLYGQTKLDGERMVQAHAPGASILRVPILYGPVETLAESAVTAPLQTVLAHPEQSCVLDDWAVRYPTHVDDVAVVLRQMLEYRTTHGGLTGIHNWSGNEPMTKFAMVATMMRHLGLTTANLIADTHPPSGAPRPQNSHLDTSALESMGIGRRTDFATGISRVLMAAVRTVIPGRPLQKHDCPDTAC